MALERQRRAWLWVAAIAIMVALAMTLVPQAQSGPASAWLAILPVFFVGLLLPLCLVRFRECLDQRRLTEAPALQPSFQRPPPRWPR